MLKILDIYILRKYLSTFWLLILLFIPIGITVHLAERIDEILENEVPLDEVIMYFIQFTIYFSNILFPLFLFISVIWFTSKLASNTEVVAFLSSGASFYRFLRPYFLGSLIVFLLGLGFSMFLAPKASEGFNAFSYKYIAKGKSSRDQIRVMRQLNDTDYIFLSYFNVAQKTGNNFTLERFKENKLLERISSTRIRYNTQDSTYTLFNVIHRKLQGDKEMVKAHSKLDTVFNFDLDDLTPVSYVAETLDVIALRQFIKRESNRGSDAVNNYKLVYHKMWATPFSVFVLTLIAVSIASIKRRGGIGLNLAFGILMGMVFIFFDKIFGTLAKQSTFSPFLASWLPNIFFLGLAIYLLRNAKR